MVVGAAVTPVADLAAVMPVADSAAARREAFPAEAEVTAAVATPAAATVGSLRRRGLSRRIWRGLSRRIRGLSRRIRRVPRRIWRIPWRIRRISWGILRWRPLPRVRWLGRLSLLRVPIRLRRRCRLLRPRLLRASTSAAKYLRPAGSIRQLLSGAAALSATATAVPAAAE